jgi:hypothetical protein
MLQIKYGLNIMLSTMFSLHMGWIIGKEVDIHPWGLRIKPHTLHSCDQQWFVDCMYPT